jgi:hypothetical protein
MPWRELDCANPGDTNEIEQASNVNGKILRMI